MMNDWTTWLGIGIGAGGLVASIVGLLFAFLARRAAKSAEQAATDARVALVRSISSIDVSRAINLIARIKEVHYRGNWDYALGLYQELRRTLSEIRASVANEWPEAHEEIGDAVPQVTAIENMVARSRYENASGEPENTPEIDGALSQIQQTLETLLGSMVYSGEIESE